MKTLVPASFLVPFSFLTPDIALACSRCYPGCWSGHKGNALFWHTLASADIGTCQLFADLVQTIEADYPGRLVFELARESDWPMLTHRGEAEVNASSEATLKKFQRILMGWEYRCGPPNLRPDRLSSQFNFGFRPE